MVLAILIFVAFDGRLPTLSLDESWKYAIADDQAKGLAFGTDVVFTFGPLSFLYSALAMPAQRSLYVALSALIVAVFTCGMAIGSSRRTVFLVLLVPVALATLQTTDAVFLVLPVVVVTAAARGDRVSRATLAFIVVAAALCGLLPLVKGTATVGSAACVLLASAVLAARRHAAIGLMLPLVAVAVMVAAWLALGQTAPGLVSYVRRQADIAAGYTNAMSTFGSPREVYAYLACAVILCAAVSVRSRWPGALVAPAYACVLAVAFKASFVRHDFHATYGAAALLFLAGTAFMARPDAWTGGAMAACVAGWAFIASAYQPVGLVADLGQTIERVSTSIHAIASGSLSPAIFAERFEAAKGAIRREAGLPAVAGPVDLYSYDQAALLAADLDYDPRPILQSYSAYTEELSVLNARHLEGPDAPGHVVFAVTPIDEHYPSLEDGRSWPDLLGRYRFETFSGGSALLERDSGATAARRAPIAGGGSFRFDEDVPLPSGHRLIWAVMRFKPTALGRVVSALWKLPRIVIDAVYEDGRTERYRMIAGMAAGGFLLSPTVASAADLVALRSGDDEALGGSRLVAFRLHQDGGSKLWGDRFDLALSSLDVTVDRGAADATPRVRRDGPDLATVAVGGDCNIERVGAQAYAGLPLRVPDRHVTISGWGLADVAHGVGADEKRVIVIPDTGPPAIVEATRVARPDVTAYFDAPGGQDAGFSAVVDLAGVTGEATIALVQRRGDVWRRCPVSVRVVLGAD